MADGFLRQPINLLKRKGALFNTGREVEFILSAVAGDHPDDKK